MVKDCYNCEHHTWGDEWWNCKTECVKCKYTDRHGEKVPSNWKSLPITNADRIRAMSDEELANFMAERNVNESTLLLINGNHGLTAIQIEALKHNIYCALMQWLRQPAEVE